MSVHSPACAACGPCLLNGVGRGLTTFAIHPQTQVKNPSEQLHVGIIGGGLGGLITAMDLAEAGHKVCVCAHNQHKVAVEGLQVVL